MRETRLGLEGIEFSFGHGKFGKAKKMVSSVAPGLFVGYLVMTQVRQLTPHSPVGSWFLVLVAVTLLLNEVEKGRMGL